MHKKTITLFIIAIILNSTLTACAKSSSGTLEIGDSSLPNNPTVLASVSQTVIPTETTQNILSLENVGYTSANEDFQAFIERWNLYGLLPECSTMTTENQDGFIKYFQQFDDVTQNYIILLLQEIAADTTKLIKKTVVDYISDYKYGVYLNYCSFCLYDMNRDGFPELILMTGDCEAHYMYTVYTVVEGKLINCGELNGSHTALYTNGSGRLVRYAAHMGLYDIDISTLEGTTLKTQKIASGMLDDSKEEGYPDLDKYGYGDYAQSMTLSGIPTLFLAPKG